MASNEQQILSPVYQLICKQVDAIIDGEHDLIANMANISAILFSGLEDVNWAGFYLFKEEQLVLGPFQGQAACIRIPLGKGVCGTAAKTQQTILVEDVHEFEGHIACDAASNSEIVIPVVKNGNLIAVLDIDSPSLNRFTHHDKDGLSVVVASLINSIKD